MAIWAAGRFTILQQREKIVEAIQGVTALMNVAVDLLQQASGVIRDGRQEELVEFDVYRFDDIARPLAALTQAQIANWRLMELMLTMLKELRTARALMDTAVTETRMISAQLKTPVLPVEEMHDIEQRGIRIYVEAEAILKLANARRGRWWLW